MLKGKLYQKRRVHILQKTTFKQGFKNMDDLIKRSNGLFQKALLLVLVPVLIINSYVFYMAYGGEGVDFTPIQSIDFNSALAGNQDAILQFSEALSESLPEPSTKAGFTDFILEFIDIIAIVFLDAFIIILGTSLLNEKKLSASLISKEALKKVLPLLILSMLSSWIVIQVEGWIYSSIFFAFMAFNSGNPLITYSAVTMLVIFVSLAILISCWFLMYIHYMAIAVASSRCKLIVALGYAKAVLKGNVWRQMFRIAPFIILGFILPVSLQAIGIALSKDPIILIVLVLISALLEVVMFAHMWMHTIPEFFTLELQSGIQMKIRQMIKNAMESRATANNKKENEDNKKEYENKEDIEPKE